MIFNEGTRTSLIIRRLYALINLLLYYLAIVMSTTLMAVSTVITCALNTETETNTRDFENVVRGSQLITLVCSCLSSVLVRYTRRLLHKLNGSDVDCLPYF
jgi:hypothetical protein